MANSNASPGATATLAAFVHDATLASLPDSARHAARRAVVNIVGCCVGGARHEIVETAARALLPWSGVKTSSLIGRREGADPLTAAQLNAMASAAYSFDDTHAETILHPSGAVAAALLAMGEVQPLSGEEFLLAFVLGIDVASRLSKAVSLAPADGDIGWSQTGIAAGVGAAAAAARALRLDAQEIQRAIAIAALQASGFRAANGTMAATLLFGNAAQAGVRAAYLARHGLTAPPEALEGKYGYLDLFATRAYPAYLTADLGTRFEVEALGYKPYPCGVVIHPAIDAALAWRSAQGQAATSIREVRLRAHPSAMALAFRRHPENVLEAKVSLYHWLAAALVRGQASISEGLQQAIEESSIAALRDRIHVQSDPNLAPESAELTVVLERGDEQHYTVRHCKGSVAHPMTDNDLSAKFLTQTEPVLGPTRSALLLEQCWAVERIDEVAHIARLARLA